MVDLLFEIFVEEFVCLVEHQKLQVIEVKAFGILKMIEDAPWSCYQYAWFLGYFKHLLHGVHSPVQHYRFHLPKSDG
jgi:hypothetical protein